MTWSVGAGKYMERKLLLLGLLRGSEMYGYQLNEIIDTHMGTSVHLTRPTAYRLLNQMAEDGWVTCREQQQGRRPTRRVFTITEQGERIFQERLRTCLADYAYPDYQSAICLAFLDQLEASEAVPLLEERRDRLTMLLESLVVDQAHETGSIQLVIDHHKRLLQAELDWMQEIIKSLKGS